MASSLSSRSSILQQDTLMIDAGLEAMDAEGLRALVRDMLLELDEVACSRIVDSLIDRAARAENGWTPDGPSEQSVAAIESFARAAVRVGRAEPSDVDAYLRQGSNAFLRREYPAALKIFRALLLPIGDCEIDLGQHEMLDEVLSADVAVCAAQYAVATYMTADPSRRVESVRSAVEDMHGVASFREPLREMESVVVEPLPELDEFLPPWRARTNLRDAHARNRR